MQDHLADFVLVGKQCKLVMDPEKAVQVNDGHLLVPWCGLNSLLIDRFDCRAFLSDIRECSVPAASDNSNHLSEEEEAIEKLCEFERYLELQTDLDDSVTLKEEEKKREDEKSRPYGAVDFLYHESNDENAKSGCLSDSGDAGGTITTTTTTPTTTTVEDPYVCPPELQFLTDVQFPDTDKQAQIIERTAVFVARQGNQMEIILKAKQKDNPLFDFLSHDSGLNKFFKEMVKLIRVGRYIPKARSVVKSNVDQQTTPDNSSQGTHEDSYELKLPKVDISNTAYASLISKFKKINEIASLARSTSGSPTASHPESEPPDSRELGSAQEIVDEPPDHKTDEHSVPDPSNSTPPLSSQNTAVAASTDAANISFPAHDSVFHNDSEQYYREYYEYYFRHYYSQFSELHTRLMLHTSSAITEEHQSAIVQQAAKAAVAAASSAVNAMRQATAQPKPETAPRPVASRSELSIIDKMAEYVTRNGYEFQDLVTSQKANDPRFGFLKQDHPLHSYYLSRLRELGPGVPHAEVKSENITIASSSVVENETLVTVEKTSNVTEVTDNDSTCNPSTDSSVDKQSSISFKLARPNSSSKLHSNTSPDHPPSTVATNIYVHSAISENNSVVSYPISSKEVECSLTPHSPGNSLVSDADTLHVVAAPIALSASPVRFCLPGIPSGSSSSSSTVSPVHSRQSSAHSSPERSPCEVPPSPPVHTPAMDDRSSRSPSESPQHPFGTLDHTQMLYPRTDIRCSPCRPPSPVPSSNDSLLDTPPVSSLCIEEILDSDHIGSVDHTADPKAEDMIRQERRRKAAQLIAHLRSTDFAPKHSFLSEESDGDTRSYSNVSSLKNALPPPPAPDSVPAAVAHAVVASLKRRYEESLAVSDAEAKARKKLRSPPAAYALPKDRSRKHSKHSSRSSRLSRSPVRHSSSGSRHRSHDKDDLGKKRHSKSKKHKTSR